MTIHSLRNVAWLAVFGLLGGAPAGTVRYVDDDAPTGGDGRSWATAFQLLQDALADAESSAGAVSEIRVAQGTYRPAFHYESDCCAPTGGPGCDDADCESAVCAIFDFCCDDWDDFCALAADDLCDTACGFRQKSFRLVDGVGHLGGYAGVGALDPDVRDIDAYPTVLSGDLLGDDLPGFVNVDDNSYRVVSAQDTGAATVFDGFTVTSGNAPSAYTGPGLYVTGGGPVVNRCRFVSNLSGHGGALVVSDVAAMTVAGCTFQGNQASTGAGINVAFGNLTINDCRFIENVATSQGGALRIGVDSAATVTRSSFHGNSASAGGALNFGSDNFSVLANCQFTGNASSSDGSGGAFHIGGLLSNPTFINCAFNANASHRGGVCALNGNSTATFRNCTMVGNSADQGGVAWNVEGLVVHNCIVWGNGPDALAGGGIPSVEFSDFEGGFAGAGNIDEDPLFVDLMGPDGIPGTGDEDLHPSPSSPCIDAGHNWRVAPDGADLDGDGDRQELTPLDLDDDPRFVHALAPHRGCGIPAIVDMGAYERRKGGRPAEVILGDINGDGMVGIEDLLDLLAAWGDAGDECELADLDLDGEVDNNDLMLALARWR